VLSFDCYGTGKYYLTVKTIIMILLLYSSLYQIFPTVTQWSEWLHWMEGEQ